MSFNQKAINEMFENQLTKIRSKMNELANELISLQDFVDNQKDEKNKKELENKLKKTGLDSVILFFSIFYTKH